jgi:hypothetical protein
MDSILGEEYFARELAEPILAEPISKKEQYPILHLRRTAGYQHAGVRNEDHAWAIEQRRL